MTRGIGEGNVVEHDVAVLHLLRRRATSVVGVLHEEKTEDGASSLLRQLHVGHFAQRNTDVHGDDEHRVVDEEHLSEGAEVLQHEERTEDEADDHVTHAEEECHQIRDGGSLSSQRAQLVRSRQLLVHLVVEKFREPVGVDGVDVENVVRQLGGLGNETRIDLADHVSNELVLEVLAREQQRRTTQRDERQLPAAQRREGENGASNRHIEGFADGSHLVHEVADLSSVDSEFCGESVYR